MKIILSSKFQPLLTLSRRFAYIGGNCVIIVDYYDKQNWIAQSIGFYGSEGYPQFQVADPYFKLVHSHFSDEIWLKTPPYYNDIIIGYGNLKTEFRDIPKWFVIER